jgi:hypothetical protein
MGAVKVYKPIKGRNGTVLRAKKPTVARQYAEVHENNTVKRNVFDVINSPKLLTREGVRAFMESTRKAGISDVKLETLLEELDIHIVTSNTIPMAQKARLLGRLEELTTHVEQLANERVKSR